MCSCQGKADRRGRSNFIGALQVDVPNTAHHFCSDCQTLWEHTADGNGVVTRKKIIGRFKYTDEITILY